MNSTPFNKATATIEERRAYVSQLYRAELKKLTPSMPGRYSGQQCAYAKGRANKAFLALN